MSSIQVYADSKDQTLAAIKIFINTAQASINYRGIFSVALSGGGTPEKLYSGLTEEKYYESLEWEKIHLFFGDERHVPSNHSDSNYRMVKEALLDKIKIPAENIHRVKAELNPNLAALDYEEELRKNFINLWPRFDLVLLGMGPDGHTASLFPNTKALSEEERWFVANYLMDKALWRLTLTKNAINAARKIVVLVNGQSKAEMLAEVLGNVYDPLNKPIQFVSPRDGELIWLLDQTAASQLKTK